MVMRRRYLSTCSPIRYPTPVPMLVATPVPTPVPTRARVELSRSCWILVSALTLLVEIVTDLRCPGSTLSWLQVGIVEQIAVHYGGTYTRSHRLTNGYLSGPEFIVPASRHHSNHEIVLTFRGEQGQPIRVRLLAEFFVYAYIPKSKRYEALLGTTMQSNIFGLVRRLPVSRRTRIWTHTFYAGFLPCQLGDDVFAPVGGTLRPAGAAITYDSGDAQVSTSPENGLR